MKSTESDHPGGTTPSSGDGGLPGWASRHLSEADLSLTDSADPVDTPPGRHSHRRGRRRDPNRLRGWALATAAVAAAAGTVPLAISSLARVEPPLPRVESFPVVAPVDLGGGGPARSVVEPGPDAAGMLSPLAGPEVADVAAVGAPVVVPTAANRPLRAAPPRPVEVRIPRARPPVRPSSGTPTTSGTPTSAPDPDEAEEPRESEGPDEGSQTGTTPRETTPTTTTTSVDEGETPDRGDQKRPRGLVSSTVDGVTGLLN